MTDETVVTVDPPPATAEHDSGLSVPPIDAAFFSQQFADEDGGSRTDGLDFDFSIDDMWIPDDLDEFLNPIDQGFDSQPPTDSDSPQLEPIFGSGSSDIPQFLGDRVLSCDRSCDDFGSLSSASPGLESDQISASLNVGSPESNASNREKSEHCGGNAKVMNCPSTESRGSENYGSNVSEDCDNFATRSVTSSPNSYNSSIRTSIVDQKIALEEQSRSKVNSSLLKRKKDCKDYVNNTVESRTIKFKKSNCNSENNGNKNNNNNSTDVGLSEEDEKRKVRLIRNRESAQLSRQRKKQYVEELEEKVRTMHSIIQDLNAKISYFMAENTTLRQQMGGPGVIPPPPVASAPPGMYPYPGMAYPWMPYALSYMMKPQGSQVPLVPIPRLKPQQPSQVPKTNKRTESKNKKNAEVKTKKVASISFIGLLCFILLFGGLAPMINVRYGGVRESLTGVESYGGGGFYDKHNGRILMVNRTASSSRCSGGENSVQCYQRGHRSGGKTSEDEFVRVGNESEPLVASLYVPRNDKLVRIDGNLVIHSVLASEKAMSSRNGGGETGAGTDLAVPGDFSGDVSVAGVGRIGSMHPKLRALGPGSSDVDNGRRKATDSRLQQWFREGLAGPMLSSGMCTEVLQFKVSSSSPSAIVPSSAPRNISKEQNNSTHLSKGRRNRRVLGNFPIPLPDSSHNITRQHSERNSHKENLTGNRSSPMVVSILVDPREAADTDVDGVMGTKSISRIFVVVLIDSVKYVTYSCMLPFKATAHHLVTA